MPVGRPAKLLILPLFTLAACTAAPSHEDVLVLAATTTIEDSGLLDTLVAAYGEAHPEVRLVPVTAGSGAVLAMARRGDVDVCLSHDPAGEERLVREGAAVARREFMHNAFRVVGPAPDPAALRGMTDAVAAFRRIAAAGAPFVSRGDASGTRKKELQLWSEAGLSPDPSVDRWYIEAGVGMGEALLLANERHAYILTEPATFLALRHLLELEPLVTGDPRLLNRYGATLPAGARDRDVARRFVDWLTGPEGQAVIAGFGVAAYGAPPFLPGPAPDSGG